MDFEEYNEPKLNSQPVAGGDQERKKTTKELWIELGRLILLLFVAIAKSCLSSIGKTLLYICALIKAGFRAIGVWWRDKSTQEKIRTLRLKTIRFLRLTLKWTLISLITLWRWTKKGLQIGIRLLIKYTQLAFTYTWKGIRWCFVNFIEFLIHMKPTVIRMKDAFREWRIRAARGRRLSKIHRKRRHEEFVRNGGMRGALERKTQSLKSSIRSYMEEEQTDANPDASTDDEIFREKFEQLENENKAHVISKKFFTSIKNIVEEDN